MLKHNRDLMAMALIQLAAGALPSGPPVAAHVVVPMTGMLADEEADEEADDRHARRRAQAQANRKRRKKQKCRRTRS